MTVVFMTPTYHNPSLCQTGMMTTMANPSVTSISFDKSIYNAGDLITATIFYVKGTSVVASTQTFTGSATDSAGQVGSLQVTFTVNNTVTDATDVSVSDSGHRTWTKVSDTGSVAAFTATA
jgi:hypothetical protein